MSRELGRIGPLVVVEFVNAVRDGHTIGPSIAFEEPESGGRVVLNLSEIETLHRVLGDWLIRILLKS